jgi:uncharacterized protein YxjI
MAGNFLPATYNIKLTKGNTWETKFTVFKDSVPVNLSAAEVRIQIRRKATSTSAEVTITEADGVTVGGVSNNEITVSRRVNIAAGDYVWDLLVINSGIYKTYVGGKFQVVEEVTEPA